MKKLWEKLEFLGPQIRRYLAYDICIGLLWFALESSFLVVLQGLLTAIGFLQNPLLQLPAWYPTSVGGNLLCLLFFGVLRTIAYMVRHYLSIYPAQLFVAQKRSLLLEHALLTRHPRSHAQMIAYFGETSIQAGSYISHLAQLAHTSLVTAFFFGTTLYVAPAETLIGTTLLVLLLVPMKLFMRKSTAYGDNLNTEWKTIQNVLFNGMKNSFFLKMYRMTKKEADRGTLSLMRFSDNYRGYALASSLSLGIPQITGVFVLVISAWVGQKLANTPPAVIVAFFYLFIRFAQMASQMNSYFSYLKLNSAGFEELRTVLRELSQFERENLQDKPRLTLNDERFELKVENLAGGYKEDIPLFSKLSFELSPSKFVLVKGPSGAGKSTLLKTTLGLQKKFAGEIKFGSSNAFDVSELADRVGYVGPEPYLIYGSVRENLLYGNNLSLDESELWLVLDLVGLKSLVSNFANKLDEILQDDAQMSTGQKQRLSFARALLRDPDLLVLDEATSNIDAETERKILEVLALKKSKLSAFIISHKSSFDHLADKVISFN